MQNRANRPLRIAIIGAGIGGMSAATALVRAGHEVDVYERADELGEVGAGLQLGPNAYKVLRALGLEDSLRRIAFEPARRITVNWEDASLRFEALMKGSDVEQFGAPFMTAHRADLHRILRQQVPVSRIHLGRACTGATSSGRTGVATFADGTEVEADLVIGADGIRSTVRDALFGADQPRFTNLICWRCTVPIETYPKRLGPGGAIAIDRSDHLSWYGPNGHVICYPIGGDGSTLNIFAGRHTTDWAEESWSIPSSRAELMQAYAGWNEALLAMFSEVEHCFKWGIFDREPRTEWTRGRVTLLGDAAHPTMPNLAQGANMAIEDGLVLARNLADTPDLDAALRGYFAERQPRTAQITLKSRENYLNSMSWPPAPPVDRSWIYRYDASRAPEAVG